MKRLKGFKAPFSRHRETIRFFQDIHDTGHRAPSYKGNEADLLVARELLVKGVEGKKTILIDVGAGAGTVTAGLADKAFKVFSVEPTKIDFEQHTVPHARIRASAHALPFPDGVADRVLASYVLEYVDKKLAVDEIKRVLKPGGRAVLLLHKHGSLHWKGIKGAARYYADTINLLKGLKFGKFKTPRDLVDFINKSSITYNPRAEQLVSQYLKYFDLLRIKSKSADDLVLIEIDSLLDQLRRSQLTLSNVHKGTAFFKNEAEIEGFFKSRGFEPLEIKTKGKKNLFQNI